MSNTYNIDYLNENEFRKKERSLKKYNMLAYKKLLFEIYPELREGNYFKGYKVYEDSREGIAKYELKLPTDKVFSKIHGDFALYYTVYEKQKIVILDTLKPEDILTEGLHNELTTYRGVTISKSHSEKDMFKINLLNMIKK